MSDPQNYRVEFLREGYWIIVNERGEWVNPMTTYATEDEADDAISEMLDEYEQEVRERRRDEDEAPYRGPTFGASYGANSAGRS